MPKPEQPPLSAGHFVNVLTHLEGVLVADLVAWDTKWATEARARLDRIAAAIKRAVAKVEGKR